MHWCAQYATLNPFPVSWNSQTGSDCTDAPAIAVRNVNGGSYGQSADAQNGDELRVRIYVHNGAQQGLDYNQTTAFSVEGGVSISGSQISTDFDGTHADGSLTNTVYGSVFVNIPNGSSLEIIPGSEEFYDYQANRISGFANLNSSSGYFSMGDMQACFEFSKFFVFRVRVSYSQSFVQPSGQISAELGGRVSGQCLYNGILFGQPSIPIAWKLRLGVQKPATKPCLRQTPMAAAKPPGFLQTKIIVLLYGTLLPAKECI